MLVPFFQPHDLTVSRNLQLSKENFLISACLFTLVDFTSIDVLYVLIHFDLHAALTTAVIQTSIYTKLKNSVGSNLVNLKLVDSNWYGAFMSIALVLFQGTLALQPGKQMSQMMKVAFGSSNSAGPPGQSQQ